MKLECEVSVKGRTFTAETAITGESIVVQEPSSALSVIDFASVEDFRLLDYQVFEYRLRHAMESVALHREVIFTDIAEHPLYQMSVHRNYHLQYLRAHHAGRVIHTASWEKQLGEFMPNP